MSGLVGNLEVRVLRVAAQIIFLRAIGQPDNYQGDEDCLHYADFKNGKGFLWADYVCSYAEKFICEVKQEVT